MVRSQRFEPRLLGFLEILFGFVEFGARQLIQAEVVEAGRGRGMLGAQIVRANLQGDVQILQRRVEIAARQLQPPKCILYRQVNRAAGQQLGQLIGFLEPGFGFRIAPGG